MPNFKIMQIVASESTPEKEAAFNKWYTEVHVPMLFAYEGVKQASRYQRIGDDEQGTKFLAIYEFETKEAIRYPTLCPALSRVLQRGARTRCQRCPSGRADCSQTAHVAGQRSRAPKPDRDDGSLRAFGRNRP